MRFHFKCIVIGLTEEKVEEVYHHGMKLRRLLIVTVLLSTLFFFVPHIVFAQKVIQVDLSRQELFAYDNGTLIYDFPVSTGKSATPTPTGGFWPYIKLRYTRMIGGNKWDGTYYNLPNVPYVIYFYNASYPKGTGYALHGTYWHNNFGHPMSHGCINLRTSDMAILYYWIDTLRFDAKGNGMGTMIVVQGVTPRS